MVETSFSDARYRSLNLPDVTDAAFKKPRFDVNLSAGVTVGKCF